MLIVALVMAVIGLAALVTAVVTSNEVIAWVCIGASVIGVLLLIVDALRERQRRDAEAVATMTEEPTGQEPTSQEPSDQEPTSQEPSDQEPTSGEAHPEQPTEAFDAEYPEEPVTDEAHPEAHTDAAGEGEPTEAASEDSGEGGRRPG
jgi:type IV secretory pathway VirB10-like protein